MLNSFSPTHGPRAAAHPTSRDPRLPDRPAGAPLAASRGWLSLLGAASLLVCVSSGAGAIERDQIDGFQDGTTQGWAVAQGFRSGLANPPVRPAVVLDAGPFGLGDDALRVTGAGGFGAGRALVVDNVAGAWSGDYTAAGVTAILLDVHNLSSVPLTLRLSLTPNAAGGFWGTDGIVVPPMSGWQTLEFGVEAVDLLPPVDRVAPARAAPTPPDVRAWGVRHPVSAAPRGEARINRSGLRCSRRSFGGPG